MALRIWPDSLPVFSSFRLTPMDETIRTTMSVGARRMRRISLDRHDTAEVAWRMTPAETALFRDWLADAARSDLGESEDISGWNNTGSWDWNQTNDPLLASAGPDGDQASRLVEDGSDGPHYVLKTLPATLADDSRYVFASTLKAAGRNHARLEIGARSGTSHFATINLSNGLIIDTNLADYRVAVKSRGNGWWRLTLDGSIESGAVQTARVRIRLHDGTSHNYLGTSGPGVDICEVFGSEGSITSTLPAKTNGRGEVLGAAGASEWFKIAAPMGSGVELREARFLAQPQIRSLAGRGFEVSARIEIADNQ